MEGLGASLLVLSFSTLGTRCDPDDHLLPENPFPGPGKRMSEKCLETKVPAKGSRKRVLGKGSGQAIHKELKSGQTINY